MRCRHHSIGGTQSLTINSDCTDLSRRAQTLTNGAINTINAKSYKIHRSIGYIKKYSEPAVLDTGCGPRLINRSILRPNGSRANGYNPRLGTQTLLAHPVRISGLIYLDLQIGELHKSITLAIV